jgi:AcrR family transcriptional regulator
MSRTEGSETEGNRAPAPGGDGRAVATAGRAGPVKPRSPLSAERIVAAALALIEEHGLPAFTFRRLGEALGCEAMSIYHYFPSKRHLIDALVAHVLAGIGEPPAGLDAIGRLRFLAWEYRAMAHRHPRFFPHAALHRLNMPAGVAVIERILRHFHAALPDDRLAAQSFRIFGYYVIGAALDETAGYAAGPSSASPVTDDYIARECTHLAAAAPYFKPAYFESTFELGLEMMLEGIAGLRAGLQAAPSFRRAPKPVVRPKA